MITLHFENLTLFLPQYIFSTVLAIVIYYYLGRKPSWNLFIVPRIKKTLFLGSSVFQSPLYVGGSAPEISFRLLPIEFNESLKSFFTSSRMFFDTTGYYTLNRFPDNYYRSASTPYSPPNLFEENIAYQMYRIMVAVTAWAGIMLVTTPFSYVYVFLPHFSNPYNIIVAIILAISIFEGVISTVFFRIGASYTKIVIVEAFVIIIYTFSLLSPSMSWMAAFNLDGKMVIYLVLLFLFTAITALISQLRTRRNLFLSSFAFATIAYLSFFVIVLVNVLQIAFV